MRESKIDHTNVIYPHIEEPESRNNAEVGIQIHTHTHTHIVEIGLSVSPYALKRYSYFFSNVNIANMAYVIIIYRLYKWEYDGTVHQLFIDFKKAYDSVKRKSYITFSLNSVSPRNYLD